MGLLVLSLGGGLVVAWDAAGTMQRNAGIAFLGRHLLVDRKTIFATILADVADDMK